MRVEDDERRLMAFRPAGVDPRRDRLRGEGRRLAGALKGAAVRTRKPPSERLSGIAPTTTHSFITFRAQPAPMTANRICPLEAA